VLVGEVPRLGTPLLAWPRVGAALHEQLRPGAAPGLVTLPDSTRIFEVQQRTLSDGASMIGVLVQLHDVTAREIEWRRVRARLAEQEVEQEALRDQALRDPLTGLLNRRALEQRFAQGMVAPAALVLLDLDHFKRINDMHGHAQGDAVLCAFAAELRSAVRSGDAVFRIGGEEFALLLPGLNATQAQQRMLALHAHLAGARLAGLAQPIGFSAGVVDASVAGAGLPGLLATADEALYRAKAAGRGRTLLAA
jgi:diguanylate cyclase (GGDEF)-like protein